MSSLKFGWPLDRVASNFNGAWLGVGTGPDYKALGDPLVQTRTNRVLWLKLV